MTAITPYVFPATGQSVRVVMVNDEPEWIAADVCVVLDIAQPASSLRLLDADEKGMHSVHTLGGAQQMVTVTEAGLYSLIMRSRKPEAKTFRRWVTHDVLPTIRRTGSYALAPQVPRSLPEALRAYAAEVEAREAAEARVAVLEPAAHAYDVLASSRGDFSLRDSAFVLNRDPGISTGQNRLKKSLGALGLVDRRGRPYASHAAHLTERLTAFTHPHTGESVLGRPQIRVTVAGLRYLHKRLGGIAPLRFDQLPLDDAA